MLQGKKKEENKMNTRTMTGLIAGMCLFVTAVAALAAVPDWVMQERDRARNADALTSTLFVQREVTFKDDLGVESVGQETINWQERYMQVSAEGVSAHCTNEAECRIQAEKIARTRAYVLLAQAVEGLMVTDSTSVMDEVRLQSISQTRMDAFIHGARVVETSYRHLDGEVVATVTVGFIFDAPEGFSSLVMPGIRQRDEQRIRDNELDLYTPPPDTAASLPAMDDRSEYTSVIIDTRGTGLSPCMSPRIITPDGSVVYGAMHVDEEYLMSVGIAGYYHSLDEAMAGERAGGNPLIIKAVGAQGQGTFKFHAEVSVQDAARILNADLKTEFLKKCAVIFLVD